MSICHVSVLLLTVQKTYILSWKCMSYGRDKLLELYSKAESLIHSITFIIILIIFTIRQTFHSNILLLKRHPWWLIKLWIVLLSSINEYTEDIPSNRVLSIYIYILHPLFLMNWVEKSTFLQTVLRNSVNSATCLISQ